MKNSVRYLKVIPEQILTYNNITDFLQFRKNEGVAKQVVDTIYGIMIRFIDTIYCAKLVFCNTLIFLRQIN